MDEKLVTLIGGLTEKLGRLPTEEELHKFIVNPECRQIIWDGEWKSE